MAEFQSGFYNMEIIIGFIKTVVQSLWLDLF